TCTLCGKQGHTIESCWKLGGGMAGCHEEVLMKIHADKLTRRGGSQMSSGHSTPHPVSAPSGLPSVHYDKSGHAYILDSVTGVVTVPLSILHTSMLLHPINVSTL
ncbi:hypothetical protein PAXRUDRAFT_175793, partial [Paxillus rubicundulus Ve08.2h10]